ncbi:rod shape-determining protein RodA [Fulvitalea axinellae]|uniref:Cell wall polymerase n=1 Tax=Fulvitalea axinellae TaxID=1182444 RepID=A0AAU9CVX9_9BACT|nr:rod shape-determining protein RodA [Fulvitalea axinellae]
MRRDTTLLDRIDWVTVLLYLALVLIGWSNIYSSVFEDNSTVAEMLSFSSKAGKQIVWIAGAVAVIVIIMVLDFKFYDTFAYVLFGVVIVQLILVLLIGKEVSGSKSWLVLGPIRLQPAEFAKFTVGLALAKYVSESGKRFDRIKPLARAIGIMAIPMVLIILQREVGSVLVFMAISIMFFREGLSPVVFVIGFTLVALFILTLLFSPLYLIGAAALICALVILLGKKTKQRIAIVLGALILSSGVVLSVDYVVNNVFLPHQQSRVKAFVNPEAYRSGAGWNVIQSKIAIGSGGWLGKGFLGGTQTKYDYVPEQSTDFIFCILGEERGWVGSVTVIALFIALFLRIQFLAERQKWQFARVYGYCVLSIMLFHFFVNVGMTIGLFPVIGIPLPFFSYGGSSLWSFTILLFILVKLDAHRMQVLGR